MSQTFALPRKLHEQQHHLPANTPFFYGWIILAISSFALVMSSPGQTYAVSIFNQYLTTELSITSSQISFLYLIGTLSGSLALPLVGRLIDAYGTRVMLALIALLFGLSCFYMGIVWNMLTLGIGFALIRMLGQGSLTLVATNAINQWWVQRRGLTLGISGVLMAILGTGMFPKLLSILIPILGWRWTYMTLGLVLIFVLAPLGYWFIRNRPEDFGLLPDGRAKAITKPASKSASVESSAGAISETDVVPGNEEVESAWSEDDWTLLEALRTAAFWVFGFAIASIAMLGTGLTFHIVTIFQDNGLSATVAANVFLPLSIASAAANLASGILVRRIPVRLIMALSLLLLAFGLFIATYLSSALLAILFGITLGATFGLQRTISTVVWADYFGRRHLGSISGVTTWIGVAGSALGPLPMGIAHDLTGSYTVVLNWLALLPLILCVASLFIGKPTKTT